MDNKQLPEQQGLYHPRFEHDACGIGMLANIKGKSSHKLVCDAIEVLNRLTHRGGTGREDETGDGAGLMIQIPHDFFTSIGKDDGAILPNKGEYGVAMLFASPEQERCKQTLHIFTRILAEEDLSVSWVRHVPTNPATIGKTAAEVCPSIYQVFIKKERKTTIPNFERALYTVSKLATNAIRHATKNPDPYFYLASCSAKTIVYKGMLLPRQLPSFYLDLMDVRVESAIALVHSRFSTNTFPSWERAHPQRILIHNGEINTIQGNANWMKARQHQLSSNLFSGEFHRLLPLIDEDGSDSAMLDNYIHLLINAGYSLPHAMAMAVPEPYEGQLKMDSARRAFYEYHNCLQEPWDGPAALAFTDGIVCGAMLDRSGLRPARYTVTKDGLLVLASETGVMDIPAENILEKNLLRPGQMLLVDTKVGRIVADDELKTSLAAKKPYSLWLEKGLKNLTDIPANKLDNNMQELCKKTSTNKNISSSEKELSKQFRSGAFTAQSGTNLSLTRLETLFGYAQEDLNVNLRCMGESGEEPIGSMGTDTPLAILSKRPQPLYNYFKQLFAQVTNPPIDALREKLVTSSSVLLGSEGNLLEPSEASCRFIKHPTPVLSTEDMHRLKRLNTKTYKSICLPMVFEAKEGNLENALEQLFFAADLAVKAGCNIFVLTDEVAGIEYAPIPALLAVSGLHQHLVRSGTRAQCSIVVAAGDAWESHHLASLISFGANAICPYMAFLVLDSLAEKGAFSVDFTTAQQNYISAATKSIIKTMSKMGISTLRSYHGTQVFEALGISQPVVDRYFSGTITRIGGLDIGHIETEALQRHTSAFAKEITNILPASGDFKWRKYGEYHLFNPENIHNLQQACRTRNYELFSAYSAAVNKRSAQLKNIRGLLDIRLAEKPLPIDLVESEESIVRHFKTGAMSYGSISSEAHECMAIAMNRLGAKSNSGEGGENPMRFLPDKNGNNQCSAIKQVASGRFGVTIHYLNHAKEIQIKMAQGAKPGEGGHLPGKKVYPWIAESRHATPGVELISPPPHHDIYSIEDLAQLIHDLKSANPSARISVKLVSEAGIGTVAVGVAKGLADVIVVSGYDGGTGAAPQSSIRHAGLPWELGIAEAHQTLLLNGLRNRVHLETDGKLLTGRDVVIAALLGAEEFTFATAPLVVMGCDMLRVCHLDTCPKGIATQNPKLRKNFAGKPEYIENLMLFLAREVRHWMSRIGVHKLTDLIGRAELLRQRHTNFTDKAKTVNLSALLYQPKTSDTAKERYHTQSQQHHLERCMDEAILLPLCRPAIEKSRLVQYTLPVTNQNRAVGCRLSGVISKKYGVFGLPKNTIRLNFTGWAGQSFGAFATNGMSLHLCGDANDFLGKGLCGGIITLVPPTALLPAASTHIIAGNVAFFGATSGEGYLCGKAGERFCVRNSGATVVVEGVGNHACEYMTGGKVLVLGKIGRNFAAGMSGGVAYMYSPTGTAQTQCNLEKAAIYPLDKEDETTVYAMLKSHLHHTQSPLAKNLMENFSQKTAAFIKLVPNEYKKALDSLNSSQT